MAKAAKVCERQDFEKIREKYLTLHQAARREPVVSSVPTLIATWRDGWLMFPLVPNGADLVAISGFGVLAVLPA